MQLRIRAQAIDLPSQLSVAIDRKLRLAVGRNAAGIERAMVTLSASQDPGAEHCCSIRVRMRSGESLSTEAHARDPQAAAAGAASRLGQRLGLERAVRSHVSRSRSRTSFR